MTHYHAVVCPKLPSLSSNNIIEIDDLILKLPVQTNDFKVDIPKIGYLFPFIDDYSPPDEGWGWYELSDEPCLFPTLVYGNYGIILHYKGKEFTIWYDENNDLTIGFKEECYVFCNDGVNFETECLNIYTFVFAGIIPEGEMNE